MIVERDRMVEDVTQYQNEPPQSPSKVKSIDTSENMRTSMGGTSQNIKLGVIKVHEHEQ